MTDRKKLKKVCDNLWTEVIKARANYQSELSGIKGKKAGGNAIITAHHIAGKPNTRLRFELANGICLVNGSEHIFGAHSKDPAKAREYQDRIIEKIGQKTYDWLLTLRHETTKPDYNLIKLYLEQQFAEYRRIK